MGTKWERAELVFLPPGLADDGAEPTESILLGHWLGDIAIHGGGGGGEDLVLHWGQ